MSNIDDKKKLDKLKETLVLLNKKIQELEEVKKSLIKEIELLERDIEIINLYE